MPEAAPVTRAFLPERSNILYHPIDQNSETLDLDFADIPILQKYRRLSRKTDSRRSPRCDHITGLERYRAREILDELRDLEDKLIRIRVLHGVAVQSKLNL